MSVRLFVRFSLAALAVAVVLALASPSERVSAVGAGLIFTAAGGGSGDGGPATAASLSSPHGVAADASGNVYIADTLGCRVRKVSGGVITTVAGNGGCGFGGDGGAATDASLRAPRGVAVDGSGDLYIADTGNCLIRKVTAGIISTIAGSGACPSVGSEAAGDGGPATSAHLWNPSGVAVSGGTLYIADTGNCRVRKVSGGIISTLAGTTVLVGGFPVSCGYSGDGGPANAAWLSTFEGLAVNAAGTVVYIADTNNCRIRQVDIGSGIITNTAGTGVCGWSGDGGLATAARLWSPGGVALDGSGNIYIADTNNCRIRQITAGVITTMAGGVSCGFSGDGGPAVSVATNLNLAGTATASDATTMTDSSASWGVNAFVGRVVSMGGSAATITSNTATVLSFAAWSPTGPTTGPYTISPSAAAGATVLPVVGTTGFAIGNTIRINAGGASQEDNVIAGLSSTSITLQNPLTSDHAYDEQVLRIPSPAISTASGVAVDGSGKIYIADTGNCRARSVTAGNIATLAGTGLCGFGGDGGSGPAAQLHSPTGVVINPAGTILYMADTNNCRVRKSTGAIITTVAGTGTCGYSGDSGPATSAMLNHPYGIALDASGNLYIADSDNCRVRKLTVGSGVITTVAGSGNCGYSGDTGAATSAAISPLTGIALDAAGNLYLADTGNCRIRKVAAGVITTIAGTGTCPPSYPPNIGDGGPATASDLYYPHGVAVNSAGTNVYIADTFNCRVRKVTGGIITTIAGTGSCGYSGDGGAATSAKVKNPLGVSVDGAGNVFIADSDNCRVRQVVAGTITTIAGTGVCWFEGDGAGSSTASVNHPYALSVDSAGEIYIGDAENNRVRAIYYTDTDGDGLADGAETIIYGTNPALADTDGDSCRDGKEVGTIPIQGGQRDPLNGWDFYNVPSPALRTNPAGTRDSGIGITTDIVALLKYSGLTSSSPDYVADYDSNGVADGLQYDRSGSTTPGMPWRSGPPDGGIGVTTDIIAMLAQVGTSC